MARCDQNKSLAQCACLCLFIGYLSLNIPMINVLAMAGGC